MLYYFGAGAEECDFYDGHARTPNGIVVSGCIETPFTEYFQSDMKMLLDFKWHDMVMTATSF